jgi:plasmid stabilization system protein ParE
MAYSVRMTRRSFSDIEAVMEWMSAQSEGRGEAWFQGLTDAIFSLEELSRIGSIAPESEDIGREIRQLFHGKRRQMYRILYEIQGETIMVLRVRHTAQAPVDAEDLEDWET